MAQVGYPQPRLKGLLWHVVVAHALVALLADLLSES